MKLSPSDIRQQEFIKQFRGYQKNEVRAFLDIAADAVESLTQTSHDLEKQLAAARDETERLHSALRAKDQAIEELKQKLVAAAETAHANMETAMTIESAKAEADKIVREARATLAKMETEIEFLSEKRTKMLALFRAYLMSQLAALPEAPSDLTAPDVTPEKKPAVDTGSVERKQQAIEDLNSLVSQRTAMFRKADFQKMLGDDAEKLSDELIDKIFSDIHKKSQSE